MPASLNHRPTPWGVVTILVVGVAFGLVALGGLIASYLEPGAVQPWSRLGIVAVVPLMAFGFLNLAGHPVGRVMIAPNRGPKVSTPAEGVLLVLGLLTLGYFTLERHLLGSSVDPWSTQTRVLAALALFPSVVLVLRSVRLLRSSQARGTSTG